MQDNTDDNNSFDLKSMFLLPNQEGEGSRIADNYRDYEKVFQREVESHKLANTQENRIRFIPHLLQKIMNLEKIYVDNPRFSDDADRGLLTTVNRFKNWLQLLQRPARSYIFTEQTINQKIADAVIDSFFVLQIDIPVLIDDHLKTLDTKDPKDTKDRKDTKGKDTKDTEDSESPEHALVSEEKRRGEKTITVINQIQVTNTPEGLEYFFQNCFEKRNPEKLSERDFIKDQLAHVESFRNPSTKDRKRLLDNYKEFLETKIKMLPSVEGQLKEMAEKKNSKTVGIAPSLIPSIKPENEKILISILQTCGVLDKHGKYITQSHGNYQLILGILDELMEYGILNKHPDQTAHKILCKDILHIPYKRKSKSKKIQSAYSRGQQVVISYLAANQIIDGNV